MHDIIDRAHSYLAHSAHNAADILISDMIEEIERLKEVVKVLHAERRDMKAKLAALTTGQTAGKSDD